MNTTIKKKSIYKLVKILRGLSRFSLDELQPIIEEIKTELRKKIKELGIDSMVGKCYRSTKDQSIIFKVLGISEDGMLVIDSIKIGGRRKILQYWVGSYSNNDQEWQIVGNKGTYGIQEIPEDEWKNELQRI